MHRGKIRGLRRFLELKSSRENPPGSLWKRMENPREEAAFLQKAPLTGAEGYQIYGALRMVRAFGGGAAPSEQEGLRWFLLYLLHQSGNGHIRISREDLVEDFPLWLAGAGVKSGEGEDWEALIAAHPRLFASLPEGRAPVLASPGGEALYLLKRWRYEQRFLQLLAPRIGEAGRSALPGWEGAAELLPGVYEELREEPSLFLGPETLEAAGMIASRRLGVITGGPGTGKTTILSGLLRLLLESSRRAGLPLMSIRLCAPTGRAAGRMEESMQELLGDPRYEGAFPAEPSTLHKLLGLVPGRPPRFGKARPLPADLVMADEASMVDLNLMYFLLDALKPGARLLLVGDKDQLPSVEAGALLSDFLAHRGEPGYRLDGAVLSLSRVHRNSGAILEGAGLVVRGEKEGFEAFLGRPERRVSGGGAADGDGQFFFEDLPEFGRFLEAVEEEFALKELKRELPPFGCSADRWEEVRAGIDRYFALYRDKAVLVPSRKGLFGVKTLNRALGSRFAPGEGPAFHGQPIMISRNDYERELFNGDRGVVLSFRGQLYAFFEDPRGGGYRRFPLSLLGDYESAFALTIHKSQGSEYGSVTLVIPEGAERLLSREILYTGITRARSRVTLYSRKDLLALSLSRGVRRHSGIREFMVAPPGTEPE